MFRTSLFLLFLFILHSELNRKGLKYKACGTCGTCGNFIQVGKIEMPKRSLFIHRQVFINNVYIQKLIYYTQAGCRLHPCSILRNSHLNRLWVQPGMSRIAKFLGLWLHPFSILTIHILLVTAVQPATNNF